MDGHSIGMFLHIAGAMGFSVALGLEWTGLRQIRSAIPPEQVRAWMGIFKSAYRVGFVSMLTTFLTGIYMMLTEWGAVAWIIVSLGALVLVISLSVALTGPQMAVIGRTLATEKRPVSQTFHSLVNRPLLWISIQTRVAITLGILFLMIAKPDWGGSLLTIGIAIVLGLASTLPVLRHGRVQAGPVDRMIIAFIVTAFVAALVLLAAKSISASTIPLSKTKSDVQGVQTKRSEVPTEVGSSNLSTQAPTPSPETALQEGPSLLQTRCTQCHPLQTIRQVKQTRTEWEKTLSKMESFNVKISDTEKKVLLDYLTMVDNP